MGCTHDCSSCGESCNSKKPENLIEKLNQYSSVKKVIGVVSGKGGVGKSLVTSTLAVTMNRKGYKTAILDADITGPSIPKSFGIHEKARVMMTVSSLQKLKTALILCLLTYCYLTKQVL